MKVVQTSHLCTCKSYLQQERWEVGSLKSRRRWISVRLPSCGRNSEKRSLSVLVAWTGHDRQWGAVERDVRAQAGRSKAKRKGRGGKIEKRVESKPVKSPMKKVVVKPEMPDPGVRQPDDYYLYGPYGPYWWRAGVIGTPIEGTLSDKIYVTYSSMDDDKEYEEQARVDAAINYDNKLKKLDEEVGLHYYWVFARSLRQSSVPLALWEEWTLVAQVVVECDTEPDKWTLAFRLDKAMRNVITQCVAWYRPDLTYVKKPKYQMRTENQAEFITTLCGLVNPNSESPYFDKFCSLLAVDTDVTEENAAEAYDKLAYEQKTKVLEHILTSHPVELLYPFTKGRRRAEMREKQEERLAVEPEIWTEEAEFTENEEEEEELAGEEEDEELTPWDEYKMFGGKEGLKEEDFALEVADVPEGYTDDSDEVEEMEDGETLSAEENGQIPYAALGEDIVESESETPSGLPHARPTCLPDIESGEVNYGSLLKAAVRPFSYRNLVKEVVSMRRMQVEYPWKI